ncbi:MAG: hypothetical protein HFH72_16780 [Lachnospiraceae bacterium]|nr:hypothetical protein [Lachnospiraceae bacterium]
MLGKILEISKQTSKGGRVPIKIALLKIHEDDKETNKNGLHWKEEYVLNAIDSVKLMPICASFCDETKSTPLDHGLTGEEIDNDGVREPLFENSETVGCFESASIEDVNVNGNDIRALVANGFLYNQRYPNFVKWVRQNKALGNVDSSIEIMGLETNDNKIIYEEAEPKDEFRTPKEFVFSGTSILSVSPADDNAIVLEVAQKQENKEDKTLDEKELKELIQSTISETNSKNEELLAKITELNSTISEKDSVIAEKEEKIVELNATVEQVQKALDDLKKEHETYWAERDALEKELGALKAKARIGELNAAIEGFSDEEKKYAESEINSFNEKPLEGNINAIVDKIYAGIGQASKKADAEAKVAEQNSAKENKDNEVIDIFSEMCSETQDNEEEDVNIF